MTAVSSILNGLQRIEDESSGLPLAGFYYASRMVVDKAKENKATLLYTVPSSVVINTASAVLGTLVGVVKLIVTPIFLAMALVHCTNKEKADFWLGRSLGNVIVAGMGILSPLIALFATIVPHNFILFAEGLAEVAAKQQMRLVK